MASSKSLRINISPNAFTICPRPRQLNPTQYALARKWRTIEKSPARGKRARQAVLERSRLIENVRAFEVKSKSGPEFPNEFIEDARDRRAMLSQATNGLLDQRNEPHACPPLIAKLEELGVVKIHFTSCDEDEINIAEIDEALREHGECFDDL
jgi:hypothetical protein